MTCSLLFSLIFAMLFVSTLGLGSVVEYSYTTRDCSGQGDVAHKWPLNKCIGIGNQPPFTESETATIATDNIVTFNYFVGGHCNGTNYQKTNQTLNKCQYFTGTTYTKFTQE